MEHDDDIPTFLQRAAWSKEQHKENNAAWQLLATQRKQGNAAKQKAEAAKRERERIERRLAQIGRAAPGSVSHKIAASFRAKLKRLGA